jgi:hypothetical protein
MNLKPGAKLVAEQHPRLTGYRSTSVAAVPAILYLLASYFRNETDPAPKIQY